MTALRVRHTPNCKHPYTASMRGCGTYGFGNTADEARESFRRQRADLADLPLIKLTLAPLPTKNLMCVPGGQIGHVKECHNPRNERCPHNHEASFDCQCKSDRVVIRKPYRLIRLVLRSEFVEGRMNRKVSISVHKDGLLEFRENGRRKVYSTNVGRVYRGCVWREAMLGAQAKAKAKAAKKKGRKRRR